jgi:hypothetical protein
MFFSRMSRPSIKALPPVRAMSCTNSCADHTTPER